MKTARPITQVQTRLNRQIELQALCDVSKALNTTGDIGPLLDAILLTQMGKMLVQNAMVLITRDEKHFRVESAKGLWSGLVGETLPIRAFPTGPSYLADLKDSRLSSIFTDIDMELVVPVTHAERRLGLFVFGRRIKGDAYSPADIEYMRALANIAGAAIRRSIVTEELDAASQNLSRRARELGTLFELGRDLNTSLKTGRIANLLANTMLAEAGVDRCLVFSRDREGLQLLASKGLSGTPPTCIDDPRLIALLEEGSGALHVDDLPAHESVLQLKKLEIRSLLPVRVRENLGGCVGLGAPFAAVDFSEEKLSFLATLGNVSMLSLENARLFEEELEKRRMEEELSIAAGIQQRLLPQTEIEIPGYEVAGVNIPSRQVGGDYFDCIRLDDERYALCMADVSGKGVPAAILMSSLHASLHALIGTGEDVAALTRRINDLTFENTGLEQFVTFFLGILDVRDNTIRFVNAGHEPPIQIARDGSHTILKGNGPILGVMSGFDYQSQTHTLAPSDHIVMFTDGVTEAFDVRDEMFGEMRLKAVIRENHHLSAAALLDKLTRAVRDFSGGQTQSDDITILVLKRL